VCNLNDHLLLKEGALVASCEAVPLGPLVAGVVAQHEPFAHRQSVELRLVPTSIVVIGDPALLARCLSNLLSNALTHAKASRILIGCRRQGECVRIWCIDDGRGIAPEDGAELFSYYTRGSDHGDEARGGYGLGLSGTRAMAKLMGGGAGHEPRWRRGSAFWLEVEASPVIVR
jgi:signal transduction histidine kinase